MEVASDNATLAPATVTARAKVRGRWPGAFGSRFFVALILGLIWAGPAWWDLRFFYAMAAWDILVLFVWYSDWRRLPLPEQLEVSRAWAHPLTQGAVSGVKVGIRSAPRAKLNFRLEDDLPLALVVEKTQKRAGKIGEKPPVFESPVAEFSLKPDGMARGGYAVRPATRGDLQVGGLFLRYQSALRLAERWAFADLKQTVRVYPNMDEARRHTFYLMRSRQIELEKRLKRQRGLGRDFESLRDFRDGDELRDVCWTAAARRGKLITKVYRVERSQTVLIVVDSGRLMRALVKPFSSPQALQNVASHRATSSAEFEGHGPFRKSKVDQSKLDYAISAALGVAQVALYSGDKVGLMAYGRKHQTRLAPGRGTAHLRSMLECLATVGGEATEADHARAADGLMSRQRSRSLVIWLTDLAETAATPEVIESASRLLRQHLVLFVAIAQPDLAELVARRPDSEDEMYRYVAAQEVVQRRDLLLRRLREQGALALELEPGRLATGLITQYLEVKERNLL